MKAMKRVIEYYDSRYMKIYWSGIQMALYDVILQNNYDTVHSALQHFEIYNTYVGNSETFLHKRAVISRHFRKVNLHEA